MSRLRTGSFANRAAADDQRAWRQRSGTVSLTVQVEPEVVAILDSLAIELYEKHPHQPPEQRSDVRPSRAEALRQLVYGFDRARQRQGGRRRVSLERLKGLREALLHFWKAEASWRRSKTGRTTSGPYRDLPREPPTPPWHPTYGGFGDAP